MTKLIGAIIVLGAYVLAIYTTDIFVYQYDWTATLIPLVIALLYFTIILWWGKRSIRALYDYSLQDTLTRLSEIGSLEEELGELQKSYAHELKISENRAKELAILRTNKLATINLNDTVRLLKTNRTGKVYAMRRVDWVNSARGDIYFTTEYQLRKGSTWFKNNEIKKVEATK